MKTKIHFGLIALAVLGLSSCVKETTLDQANPDTPIVFDTYLGRAAQTKGGVATLDAPTYGLQTTGFGVYAYYTYTTEYASFQDGGKVADFMVNEKLSANGNKWTYSPVKYWPNNTGDMLSFYAYAPYYDGTSSTENIVAVTASDAGGDPTVTFAVASDVTKQVDLLYAALPDQKKPTVIAHEVKFNFQHALSRVAFKAQAVVDEVNDGEGDGKTPDDYTAVGSLADGTTVTINKVTLTGKFYTGGVLNLTNGSWNTGADPTLPTSYTISGSELAVTNVTAEVSDQINKTDDYMMLIPGTFDGMTVTVEYVVETQDDNLASGSSKITNIVTSQPFDLTLAQGNAYCIVLHLGMNSVKLSAQVTDWTPEATVVANVPLK